MRIFRRLLVAERGTILVMAAFALTAVMGMSGLAVEVGNGYATKIRNQRVADMAALGAAQAYQASQSASTATKVAKDIVAASGLPASAATVTAPVTVNGVNAIQVTVTTAVPVRLAQVVMNNTSYNVTNTAAASLTSTTAPNCFATLSSGGTYGITLTGGTSLTASGCGVATNSGVSLTSGTHITAKQVVAGKTVSDPGSGISTSPTTNNIKQNKGTTATDTVGTDPRVVAGFAKIGTAVSPTAPTGTTQAWNFDWNHTGAVAGWWNSATSTYTVPAGTYNISSMSVAGGIKVVVQDGAVMRMSGGISEAGTSVTMGAVTLDVGGQINVTGGSTMTIASGNVTIGNNGSGNAINVDGGCTFTMGNGTFGANGGITTGGGSSITFGATTAHYINGSLALSGNATFGAGAYFINGGFSNGTGGTMSGTGVTFFMSGALSAAGGATMNLSSPTADTTGGAVTDLLFATKSTAATSLGGGATATYAGMIYAPNSDVTMSGGASAAAGSGRCFAFLVNTLTLTGGTTAGTSCTGIGSSGSSGGLSLLQ